MKDLQKIKKWVTRALYGTKFAISSPLLYWEIRSNHLFSLSIIPGNWDWLVSRSIDHI